MEVLCDQAIESLDHTAQKDKSELAQRGKLGKRRRPSRASLKAQLSTQVVTDRDDVQATSDTKIENEVLGLHHDWGQVNGDYASTVNVAYNDQPIIKQGPKGTVIEIGNTRIPDAATVIRISYPMEENAVHTGAVVTGAILKSPERRLSEMTGTVDYQTELEPEVVESEDENEEANCKRWKSLPSLWQAAAKCKESKKELSKEEDEAPWAHEVKLRHVEDPECVHRGCSMLFFGPLPKSPQSSASGRGDTIGSGNDSQLPDTQHNGTDIVYRPIRPRPSSVCDQVQIQTWDRRHLTSSSRTNVNDAQQKCELFLNDSVSNLQADALLFSDVIPLGDKPTADLSAEKKPATYKRPKPKKRWKLDVMDKGVQRSKSLNGIDKNDQPEWIELSRRLTSRNIDWDNLPIIKSGGAGKNLQSELKLAWKIKGTQERAENHRREDGKEEIVLKKEDLAIIPNGFTKPNKANRWEKLDSNANISQRQKTVVLNPTQNSIESQRCRTLPQQPSAQEETVSWIKEAEKRRQKYMDWQSQETMKLSNDTSNQKSHKVPNETPTRRISTLPEIGLKKIIPTKLLTNEQMDPMPITEAGSDFKKEKKIKDAVREELNLFSVKLRRVRCAKPEECFHEVKCQPVEDNTLPPPPPPPPEAKAIVVPTITQPPVPSPRTKKPCKIQSESTPPPKDIEPKPTEELTPRDTFSVQVSEQESDNFFIVINDQDSDSFLQIKAPKDMKVDKLSKSNVKETNVSTPDQSERNLNWSATHVSEQHQPNILSVTPSTNVLTNEHNETSSVTNRPICNGIPDSSHIIIDAPINGHSELISKTDTYREMETMFNKLSCEEQPESILHIDLNANESMENGIQKDDERELMNGNLTMDDVSLTNSISDSAVSVMNNDVIENGIEDGECLYGKIHKIPNGIIPHQNNYLNLNGHRNNRKSETAEEKAARMTSEICGVLSSLGNRKTEAEKLALHMDILTTLTCPNAVCPKNTSARTMTFVTCNGDSTTTPSQICGPQSVGVQTNGVEMHDSKIPEKIQKKAQTRIKKKTVKIIIHECDDDDEKQEVVEEIVEEILEPRSQKGRMVKTPSTISRTIAEAEDGSTYLTTTVMDNCVFRPEDAT